MKSTIDLTAVGLFLISIFILVTTIGLTNEILILIGRWSGIAGSVILILVEGVFLWQTWVK